MEALLARFFALWVRARLEPADAATRLCASNAPVCYVLERRSAVDLAVLRALCARERLPRPLRRLLGGRPAAGRAAFALERPVGLWRTRLDRRVPAQLLALVDALRADPAADFAMVPVAVFWGRAPQKERSLIRLLLSESWGIGSRLRRAFTVLVNGRNVIVQLGEAQSLRSAIDNGADGALTARRVARALRATLARARASDPISRTGAPSSPRCCARARCARRSRHRCASAAAAVAARRCSRRAAASMRLPPTTRTPSSPSCRGC